MRRSLSGSVRWHAGELGQSPPQRQATGTRRLVNTPSSCTPRRTTEIEPRRAVTIAKRSLPVAWFPKLGMWTGLFLAQDDVEMNAAGVLDMPRVAASARPKMVV